MSVENATPPQNGLLGKTRSLMFQIRQKKRKLKLMKMLQ
jgi:hypothetical protein